MDHNEWDLFLNGFGASQNEEGNYRNVLLICPSRLPRAFEVPLRRPGRALDRVMHPLDEIRDIK